MWTMDPSSVFFCESNGLLFCPPCPWWSSRELDVLYHLQIGLPWLRRLPCWNSSYNDSYFPKWGSWWLFCLSFQLLVLMISSNKYSPWQSWHVRIKNWPGRLTKGGNVMNDAWKDMLRVKKLEKEKMVSARTTQGVPLHIRCHTWRGKWIKWGKLWKRWRRIWKGWIT